MAVEDGSTEPDGDEKQHAHSAKPPAENATPSASGDSEEEDEEEDEPRLKYATLTKNLSFLYRNGDASSTFFVSGDKMIVGSHNGNIHVLSLPAFQQLRTYHAHSASISAISISPFLPPLAIGRLDATTRLAAESVESPGKPAAGSPSSKGTPKQAPVPPTPSNQIYIATSSIDGNVCVASLVDPNDVQLRNFGRPVQTVALSPEYKSDRTYLSGGQAGNLILTTGGQAGRSANATTTGAAAAASGWLGSIGLGANTGTDKVLHSGEGTISMIKWSRSGKYVLWVNEEGIKIMRTGLQLENIDAGLEWKRLNHIPRPAHPDWEDMSGVWKARAEWIDRENLESDEGMGGDQVAPGPSNGNSSETIRGVPKASSVEEAVVGWGDRVWMVKVYPSTIGVGKDAGERKMPRAEVAKLIRFDDCTISGVSLYTPNLLLVLAYMERKESAGAKTGDSPARKGRHHRQNALEPELRLVDINTTREVDTDTLSVSRFETLSASDYHLGVLPPVRISSTLQKGYLGAIGSGIGSGVSTIGSGIGTVGHGLYSGVETVGQGVIDATLYPARMFSSNKPMSGTDSVRSGGATEKTSSVRGMSYLTGWIPSFGSGPQNEALNDVAGTQGMKIFVYSPYDCIVAVKRNLADRLQWLCEAEKYEEAWVLLNEHPEAAWSAAEVSEISPPPSPSKASSVARSGEASALSPTRGKQQATLAEFFADDGSISSSLGAKNTNSSAEKEKRRIGELWLQQLTAARQWSTAADVASRVLNTTNRWDHWIWLFIKNKKFDEISPVVPTFQITPPLQSLIYEIILGHYVSTDRARFKELLDQWPSDLFEISSITNYVEDQLQPDSTTKDSPDWRILQECLAKLYLAEGQYREALRCYVRLQDADTALAMIKEHHLVNAISDDIPALVLLRISPDQVRTASQQDLESLSSDPVKLLVDEATHGVVKPEDVVTQLQDASLTIFLFFYLRALWRGEGTHQKPSAPRVGHMAAIQSLAADEGKVLVEQFADTAVELFAEFDRDLLMDFLHTSTHYTFEKAVAVCERKHYVEELVYLLSKTGQMKKALYLIIDELKDVSKAIAFAKDQDDKDLWDDLLDYSMSRPRFISGLLAEVGTAIDPVNLVKRIPSGLEIDGLRDGLKKMIREYDLQDSISTGVAKVLASEVAVGAETLRKGRRRGIKFDVGGQKPKSTSASDSAITPGICSGCRSTVSSTESETLVGFACGHVYHASHLLSDPDLPPDENPAIDPTKAQPEGDDSLPTAFTRSVGAKVTNARLLKDKIESARGCRICRDRSTKDSFV